MKILQFGTGRFLRGYFAPIVSQPHSITVVQSRLNSNGAELINAQPDGFHVWTRGLQNGQIIDEFETVRSFAEALIALEDWPRLRDIACDPELRLVVSNTTAAGLTLDPADMKMDLESTCPSSFPAKLVALLHSRFQRRLSGLTILPLELVENNGTKLKSLVLNQSGLFEETNDPAFHAWLENENRWLNNLVDRIVVNPSDPPPWSDQDALAVVAEPFRMLAIESDGGSLDPVPAHEMITWTDDLKPFFLRKVRILNGLHTAMVAKFLPAGFETVLQCVSDEASRRWLDELLFEEILPTLAASGLQEERFARDVMERFENPFFQHQLADIANGHATKLTVRIQPTCDEFERAFNREPEKLNEVLKSSAFRASQS